MRKSRGSSIDSVMSDNIDKSDNNRTLVKSNDSIGASNEDNKGSGHVRSQSVVPQRLPSLLKKLNTKLRSIRDASEGRKSMVSSLVSSSPSRSPRKNPHHNRSLESDMQSIPEGMQTFT